MAQRRDGLGRAEAEAQRLSVWHGVRRGEVVRAMRTERPECSPRLREGLRAQAEGLLRAGPAR